MNKKSLFRSFLLTVCSLVVTGSLLAQVNMTGVSDSTAVINESFTANVIYTVSGGGTPTFSLEQAPAGMSIGSSNGVISYSPDDMSDGGRITVKAENSMGEYYYSFSLYISSAIACSPDLISYYNLDESGGTSFDDYAGGYTATSGISLTSTTGKVDNAQIMAPASQSSDFLTVADANQYEWTVDEDFSFSFWIYPYGKSGFAGAADQVLAARWLNDGADKFMIMGFDEDLDILYPRFRLKSNGVENSRTSTTALPENQWVHIAYVYDAYNDASAQGYMRVFMNGTQVMNSYVAFNVGMNFEMDNTDLSIGYFIPVDDTDFPFDGVLDEVLIYNKALTQTDINEIIADGDAGIAHCKPGNTAPEFINNFPATVDEDASYLVNLVANDLEDDPVTISPVSYPSWMTYSAGPKQLSGTPVNDDVGTYTITFTLDDGTDLVTKNIPVEVVNVNDLPTITSTPSTSVNEDVAYTYTLVANDVDAGDVMTMTAETIPGWLGFDPGTGVLTGTPTNDDFSDPKNTSSEDFDVELRVYDLSGEYTPQTFTITVTNVNDDPVLSGQNNIETDENVAINITPVLAFTEGINLIDVDNVFPDDFSLVVQDGTNYTHAGNNVTPATDYSGTLAVPIILSENSGGSVTYTLNVNVAFVNDIPEVTSTDVTSGDDYEEYEYVITVEDGDPGDVLTITGNTIPDWLTLDQTNNNTAILSGTPLWDDIGANAVVIDIDDGHVAEPVHHTFTITVGNTNTVPEITSDPITYAVFDEVYAYNIVAEDPDEDDDLTFEVLSKPSWLTLDASGGSGAILYGTPSEAESGSYDILIQVSDGKDSDQQNFQLTVGPDAVEDNILSSIMVYPIPVNDVLYIEYSDVQNNAILEIMSITGKTMYRQVVASGKGKLDIDVNSYESGMYFYRLVADDQIITGRIIIE